MKIRFRVSLRAGRQIRAVETWWSQHRAMSPTLFAEELEAAYELLRLVPSAGEVVARQGVDKLRRILLSRTRYYLYYIIRENESVVELVALWHTSRGNRPPV